MRRLEASHVLMQGCPESFTCLITENQADGNLCMEAALLLLMRVNFENSCALHPKLNPGSSIRKDGIITTRPFKCLDD